jgi:C4-dicarboxylate transporter/malic acid transport protein
MTMTSTSQPSPEEKPSPQHPAVAQGRGLFFIAEHFSPAWFASVMGTAVIPLAMSFIKQPWVRPVAAGFFILAMLMYIAAFGPWITKIIRFPRRVKDDLNHPIAGSFLPTMPIALIVISLCWLKYPDLLASETISHHIALVLWLIGAIGIYLFGFVILMHIFRHPEIKMEHANFGWYIPPVSKLIIPVAGFEIAHLFPNLFEFAFGLSIASLGVGFFLFLFVGATVYHRYVYHELPVSKIAATFFVGIAPTAIIAVDLSKLMHLIELQDVMGIDAAVVAPMLKLLILINWGLAAWWFLMALLLTICYIKCFELPYALSWWAFTFPSGALAVATGIAWSTSKLGFLWYWYLGVVVFLLCIWLLVAARTLHGMITGKVFQPAH